MLPELPETVFLPEVVEYTVMIQGVRAEDAQLESEQELKSREDFLLEL